MTASFTCRSKDACATWIQLRHACGPLGHRLRIAMRHTLQQDPIPPLTAMCCQTVTRHTTVTRCRLRPPRWPPGAWPHNDMRGRPAVRRCHHLPQAAPPTHQPLALLPHHTRSVRLGNARQLLIQRPIAVLEAAAAVEGDRIKRGLQIIAPSLAVPLVGKKAIRVASLAWRAVADPP